MDTALEKSQDVKENKKPVIVQVIPELETGGAERGCVDVAKAIKQAGGTAIVVSQGGRLVHELNREEIRHVELPVKSKNPLVIWKNIQRLESLIHEVGADIIQARSRAPAWSAYKAAQRAGIPYMTTFHAAYKFKSRLKKFYNSVMAKGERVIAVSDFIRDHILENYEIAPENIVVIKRGIDLGLFSPVNVPSARFIQIAQKWGVPEDKKVIMLPGRLTRIKGQTVMLEALGRLKERNDFICVFVGGDQGRTEYRRELEQMTKDLGIEHLVRFADHCDDMAAAYMLADVVVNNSIVPEAFGRVIVEAQVMGKPVIVTNHGAVKETLIDGKTGWVIAPNNVDQLTASLQRALDLDDETRGRMAAAAISHVSQNFSKEKMCFDTLKVYSDLSGIGLLGDWEAPRFMEVEG